VKRNFAVWDAIIRTDKNRHETGAVSVGAASVLKRRWRLDMSEKQGISKA